MPEGEIPTMPDGEPPAMPGRGEGGDRGQKGGFGQQISEGSAIFYMQDKVNFFSGLTARNQ